MDLEVDNKVPWAHYLRQNNEGQDASSRIEVGNPKFRRFK